MCRSKDEHEWDPHLYITRDLLRRRMQILADSNCNVLSLDEAIRRLYEGSLPERAVAITFDDGSYDFYQAAWPVVSGHGFPVTVYLTTYYSEFNRPVFDTMCSYLLWKGRGAGHLCWPEVFPAPVELDKAGRRSAVRTIKEVALSRSLSGREKDELLGRQAGALGIDYESLCRKRLLHIMTPDEVRAVAQAGVDIQMHTHRHRVWRKRDTLFSEFDENRIRIAAMSVPSVPMHFCYTSGFYLPEYPGWLTEYGMLSATTCKPGLCSRHSNRMLLPRLVDNSHVSETEFSAWLSGVPRHLTPAWLHHG